MLLPTPRVLVVVVGLCFLVLFAVNSLNAGSRLHDWHSSNTSTTSDNVAHEDKEASEKSSVSQFREIVATGMRVAIAK